jgi:hypothetical protein
MCLNDSTGRRIRPCGDFAIVRRSKENAIIPSALQLSVRHLYIPISLVWTWSSTRRAVADVWDPIR